MAVVGERRPDRRRREGMLWYIAMWVGVGKVERLEVWPTSEVVQRST